MRKHRSVGKLLVALEPFACVKDAVEPGQKDLAECDPADRLLDVGIFGLWGRLSGILQTVEPFVEDQVLGRRKPKRIEESVKEMGRQVRLKRVNTALPDPHSEALYIVRADRVALEDGGVDAVLPEALRQGEAARSSTDDGDVDEGYGHG